MENLYHILIGACVGTYGSMVGAGGGFLLIPIFLLLHRLPADVAVGTSLVIVTANAISGSVSFIRQKQINFRAALLFGVATLPGAYFGVKVSHSVPHELFQRLFGGLLIAIGFFLFFRKQKQAEASAESYAYNAKLGVFISLFVGFVSSFFGIGGGILHVPLMSEVLGFPVRVAVATSQFILLFTAMVGAALNVSAGKWDPQIALWTGVGAVIGAQVGARLTRRVKGAVLLRYLALALVIVGIRLIW